MFSLKYLSVLALALMGLWGVVAAKHDRLVVVGDVTINIGKDHFRCDRIACPPHTQRCVVAKESQPNDRSTVLRSNICYSKKNEVLKQSLTYQTIHHDKTEIKELMDVHRNGHINILSSNDFDEKKFKKEFSKFQKGMSHEMGKLNKDMAQLDHKLERMFV